MQLDIDQAGLVHLTLEPDEHIFVKIGGAEVILTGGVVDAPGEGPLVQVMLQESTARLKMKHSTPRPGNEQVDVRIVPEETHEP